MNTIAICSHKNFALCDSYYEIQVYIYIIIRASKNRCVVQNGNQALVLAPRICCICSTRYLEQLMQQRK